VVSRIGTCCSRVCLAVVSDERSDLEQLAAWRGGDAVAGQLLFKRHFRKVYRFFETKSRAEADELVQSTFLGDSSFATYLFTIARHELYRVLSERRRDLGRLDFDVSSIAELAPTPRTQIAAEQDRLRLLQALRDLPVEQQAILELHYWEGVEIGQLAEIFESPAVTIRSRLHRARTALRDRLLREPGLPAKVSESLESLDAWAKSLAQ
jgi:RNA polymerase sigma factor (sigma-70 family)